MSSTAIKYIRFTGFPLLAWLLVLPFTGVRRGLWVAAIALFTEALWLGLRGRFGRGLISLLSLHLGHARNAGAALLGRLGRRNLLILLTAAFVFVPLLQSNYERDIMTLAAMYVVLALGLNIVVGQTGLLNLGYVAFYAIGAYTYAILNTRFGLSFWPGLLVGAGAAGVCAVLVGVVTLRLRGDYFAIVTLGLGEISRIVINNWDSMTGGPNGISDIGRPVLGGMVFSSHLHFYYLILAIAVVMIFGMHRLISSRVGRAWIAIREDETAAEAMGIDTFRMKLLAFVLGSLVAGLVGVFFAAKMAFVSPESFTFFESVIILCMVVLGGMGSIPGIVLGAFLLILLPEVFRGFQDYRMIAFGLALVLMMIFRPQGLLGRVKT